MPNQNMNKPTDNSPLKSASGSTRVASKLGHPSGSMSQSYFQLEQRPPIKPPAQSRVDSFTFN